jgi:hypothetical protein
MGDARPILWASLAQVAAAIAALALADVLFLALLAWLKS